MGKIVSILNFLFIISIFISVLFFCLTHYTNCNLDGETTTTVVFQPWCGKLNFQECERVQDFLKSQNCVPKSQEEIKVSLMTVLQIWANIYLVYF